MDNWFKMKQPKVYRLLYTCAVSMAIICLFIVGDIKGKKVLGPNQKEP